MKEDVLPSEMKDMKEDVLPSDMNEAVLPSEMRDPEVWAAARVRLMLGLSMGLVWSWFRRTIGWC